MIITTDPIADMLSRLRNAMLVRKSEVTMPHSRVKEAIARLLQQNGFLNEVRVSDAPIGKTLAITINNELENARITEIVRLSKPGRRYYVKAAEIPIVRRGRGVVIVSTSRGIMTGQEAKNQGVGGELICRVY